jgi:hypothetical protein
MVSFSGSSIDVVLASAEANFAQVHDPYQKLAVVMAAAMEVNTGLTSQQPGTASMMISGNLADKLSKAIERFTKLLSDISRSLTGVISFSIGVSATGLSIAVNFSTPQPGGVGYGLQPVV